MLQSVAATGCVIAPCIATVTIETQVRKQEYESKKIASSITFYLQSIKDALEQSTILASHDKHQGHPAKPPHPQPKKTSES